MKYEGHMNTITFDIDELKYLARQKKTWEDSYENKKIDTAAAILKLLEAAQKQPVIGKKIAYKETTVL